MLPLLFSSKKQNCPAPVQCVMGIRSIAPLVAPWNVGFRSFGPNIVCISVMNVSIDSGRREIECRPLFRIKRTSIKRTSKRTSNAILSAPDKSTFCCLALPKTWAVHRCALFFIPHFECGCLLCLVGDVSPMNVICYDRR